MNKGMAERMGFEPTSPFENYPFMIRGSLRRSILRGVIDT